MMEKHALKPAFQRHFVNIFMTTTSSVTYRHIWTIAYPVLISLLTEHLISLTDTAFLGRVGEIELGASALGGVYYWVVFMLGLGFSLGAQIMIGRRNGEKLYAETGPIVVQGIFFMLLLAGLAFTLTRGLSPGLMGYLLSSPDVYDAAIQYLDWRAYGFFFAFCALMFRAFFVGIEQTKAIGICSVIMVLVNVVLNYLLIFGKFGFPQMGIAGAALASTIAEGVLLVTLIVYVRFRVNLTKYGFSKIWQFKPRLIGQVFAISIWTMLQFLISDAVWLFFLIAVEHLGERPLAISNLVRSFSILLFMPLSAMAVAATTVTSNLMGANRHTEVMGSCWKAIKLCTAILLPVLILSAIWPEWVVRIYTDNQSLIEESIWPMRVAISSYIIVIPTLILFDTLIGTGNTRSGFFLELPPITAYGIFIYIVVVHLKMPLAICLLSEHVYWLILLVICYAYMTRVDWQSRKI